MYLLFFHLIKFHLFTLKYDLYKDGALVLVKVMPCTSREVFVERGGWEEGSKGGREGEVERELPLSFEISWNILRITAALILQGPKTPTVCLLHVKCPCVSAAALPD